ncbi:MAG TPA: hypothetical protein VII75_11240 [Thermoanaerobaculia bacterium]|nr:hypothetical protein [Thermoanaerobaculia bacterium]
MPNLHDYHDDDIVNVETHHEKSDVNVRALFIFAVAFVIFAAISHFVLFVMYKQFVKIENKHQNVPLTKMQRPDSMIIPATPRLQPFPSKISAHETVAPNANTPVTDMVEMREAQEKALNSYGYVDKAKGVVHIPIEEAKKLALQRGFPAMTSPSPAAAGEGARRAGEGPTQ